MVRKIFIWVLKIVGAFAVFVMPMIYLVWKFNGTETVTSTTSSMPMAILLIISLFGLILIMWLGSQILSIYWEYVKKHPFGFVSTLTFGSIILLVTVLGIQWINKLSDLINYNSTRFIEDLGLYKHSMYVVLAWVGIGLVISLAGFIYEKATA